MKVLGFVVLFALVASIFTLPLQRENEPKSLTEVEELEIDANVNTWLEKVEDIAEFPDDIKDEFEMVEVNGKVDDWFKKVWAKITKFFQDLGEKIKEAFKDFGIDMKDFGKKVKEAFDKLGAKIKEAFDKVFSKEKREQIKQMFKHYADVVVAEFKRVVMKYKDLIIEALMKDGKVIVAEGQKLLIAALDAAVKLIVDIIHKIVGNEVLYDDLPEEANINIKDLWEKIKQFIKAYLKDKEEDFEKMVTKYKPRLIELLKNFGKTLAHEGKGLAIDLLGDLIKIIIGWGSNDEPMELLDDEVAEVNGKVDDWFKKVWAKITKFFQDLGEKIKVAFKDFGIDMKDFGKKIKEAFDKLGAKIKEIFNKVFPANIKEQIKKMFQHYGEVIVAEFNRVVKKYLDLIVSALTKDWKVIFEEGQKLLIAALDEGVKLIINIIKKITGNDVLFDDIDDEANGIKDIWEIIKKMVKAFLKKRKKTLKRW